MTAKYARETDHAVARACEVLARDCKLSEQRRALDTLHAHIAALTAEADAATPSRWRRSFTPRSRTWRRSEMDGLLPNSELLRIAKLLPPKDTAALLRHLENCDQAVRALAALDDLMPPPESLEAALAPVRATE